MDNNQSNDNIDKKYDLEIRPLIDLVDSLRHVGISATDSDSSNNIYLPQIAVMGDQSSGKSSKFCIYIVLFVLFVLFA